jgi:hypothetical protein
VPRRVIHHVDHDSERSLGLLAAWWIETFTVHGPGAVQGEPSLLVDEFFEFVNDCYALDANGKRLYDSAFFSRPKGCDKSGLASKIALFEAFGPCRFLGWAEGGETFTYLGETYTYERGEAMGKPVRVPYVRIMATEEGQTGNVYDVIHFNLSNEDAPLYQLRAYGQVDVGLTRIILADGGEITPSTSGAASKDGGKETFVVFDESHLYVVPQLRQMYSTVTRNTRKRKKEGSWFIETTTMYAPGQESIAEATYQLADLIEQKKARRARLLFDHRWGDCEDLSDEVALRNAINDAFGDAMQWNDVEGIIDGIFDPREAEVNSRRYFLNALTEGANAWVNISIITKLQDAARSPLFEPPRRLPGAAVREKITLGFDGSITDDATALIACRVSDRHLFPILIEEVPDGPEAKGWSVNREAFDNAVAKAFRDFDVVGFYGDPPHWQDYVDAWARRYEDHLKVHASGRHSIEWWTNRHAQMSLALERLHTAMMIGDMSMDGSDTAIAAVMRKHFLNARVWQRSAGAVIGKDRKGSSFKMDAAVAATLAFEAAADYRAKDHKEKASFVPARIR